MTGGSRGIGAGIVRRLAAEGAEVAFTYNSGKEEADAIVTELAGAGRKAVAIQADLAEAGAAATVVDAAVAEFGRLDIVVNNAGVTYWRPLAKTPLEDIEHLFALDARAPYLVIQAAADKLAEGGRVINISSSVTSVALPGSSLYSGVKAFVDQVTKVAAFELAGRGITVNAVAPGTTATGRWSQMPAEQQQHVIDTFALGRVGEPKDTAGLVAFLASEDAGFITGQVIYNTGGQS